MRTCSFKDKLRISIKIQYGCRLEGVSGCGRDGVKGQVGLYCDDGLAVCNATAKQIEKTKQEVSDIFKSNGLKITIEANKTINLPDVILDLPSKSYKPFTKPNNLSSMFFKSSMSTDKATTHPHY